MKINFNKINFSELEIEKTELISFLAGAKPSLLHGVYNVELTRTCLVQLSPGRKLYFVETSLENLKNRKYLDRKIGFVQNREGKRKWLAISRDKKIAEELAESFCNDDRERVGRLLGYPKCCVKQCVECSPEQPTIQGILRRTRGRSIYYTNNLFNLQSRLAGKEAQNLKKLDEINDKTGGYAFYLIFHIPCSYNCEESINIGKGTLEALKTFDSNPETPKRVEKLLKKPVLFFDDFHWVVFNGKVEQNNTILYSSISLPKSLIKNEIVEKVRKGDRIFLKKKNLTIFMGDEMIDCLNFQNFEPIILNFQPS